jgi:tetratricopeptide (TPR) repeat protein
MEKQLDSIINDLDIIDGRYTTGSPLVSENPDTALDRFQEAFEADARLMPNKEVSELSRRMHVELSSGFLKLGTERFDQQRFVEAAPYLQKAYKWNPSNTDAIEILKKIEDAADEYMNRGCDGLLKARQLLRENSPKMPEVRERIKKMQCE